MVRLVLESLTAQWPYSYKSGECGSYTSSSSPPHHARWYTSRSHTHSARRNAPPWKPSWHPVVPLPHTANSGDLSCHLPAGVDSWKALPLPRGITWWQFAAGPPHTQHRSCVSSQPLPT